MYQRILVGTDGSATADSAVVRAAELAHATGGSLTIVSAFTPALVDVVDAALDREGYREALGSDSAVDATLAGARQLAASHGIQAETRAERGDPVDAIVEAATAVGADLIVVGNKGMQRRILGSVPNSVAHRAPCDVLIVHTT